jgi:RimJ/RimL family protein N-acetyltransferase
LPEEEAMRDGKDERDSEGDFALRTARLMLRRPHAQDRKAIAALAASPGVAGNVVALADDSPRSETFALVERTTGSVIGATGYAPTDDWPTALTITVWLGEQYWGRGLATEATQRLIDRAFCDQAVTALWCFNRVSNERARRVVEKCGFQFRGTGMSRPHGRQGAMPVERFILERRNWKSLKGWADGESGHAERDDAA